MSTEFRLRPARADDHQAVIELCADVWADRDIEYLPDVYPDWIRGDDRRTLIAEVDDRLVGLAQCVLVSEREGWCQGLRVHPDTRGRGVASRLVESLFDWARDRGAVVARNLVYSWNAAGMGHSRVVGFEPVTAVRWAYPEPDSSAQPPEIVRSADAAWQAWLDSDAREVLSGLAADRAESWAMSECRERDVHDAADAGGAIAVVDDGLRGMAVRGRRFDVDDEGPPGTGIEYCASAWEDDTVAKVLLDGIAADADECGASEVRVLVPESPRHVSDVAYAGVEIDEAPHLIFAADLLRSVG